MCVHVQTNTWNGIPSGPLPFGSVGVDGNGGSVDGTNEVELKFELHSNSTRKAVVVPYMKFSLFDFDKQRDGNGGEVSRAPRTRQ